METPAGMRSNSVNSRAPRCPDNAEPSRRYVPAEGVETGRARPTRDRYGGTQRPRHSPDHEPGREPGGESRSGTKICRPRGHPSSSLGHPKEFYEGNGPLKAPSVAIRCPGTHKAPQSAAAPNAGATDALGFCCGPFFSAPWNLDRLHHCAPGARLRKRPISELSASGWKY